MRGITLLVLQLFTGACIAAVVATDDLGNRVELPEPAGRVISLAPHITEMLFALGVGHRIAGTSRYSDYPPAARELPVIGDAFTMNVEAIAARQPDLVFAWQTGGAGRAMARLKSLDIPVYVNEAGTIDGIGRTLLAMATLVGQQSRGETLKAGFEADVNALAAAHRDRPGVRVFFQISDQDLYTVNDQHLIGQAIAVCNGINVFGDQSMPVPLVSQESVLARSPDVIIISRAQGRGESPWLARWSRYPGYADKLRWIEPGLVSRPSLRMLEGMKQMCELIHRDVQEVSHEREG